MNKQIFLSRFLFHNRQNVSDLIAHKSPLNLNQQGLKKAAVLLPLIKRQNGLNLIFTERALHLRHHPGQISFPGGRYEPSDHSLQQTALRETEEEIGILQRQVSLFGSLPNLPTGSGFMISPFLGFIDNEHTIAIEPQEVRSVFEVPLSYLLDVNNYYKQHLFTHKKRHFTYCIPYQNRLIWGATAQILKNLQEHLAK
ncbi:nucleotide phosphate derivative pyrophosphohydrolase, MutT/nudix family protein [Psychromonas ingrahamii 37]|uniref:Nucleotide phosphate derivative pyrophosphohydrolase, MutT/nudix family protein n=1 Tax=Psychromonas ingrahamii (strain DSM 17664 / CCUG 51855 / 37) TaxID=357804 RepID=A1SST3_PSYIN|nr:CoA pyrophosphatase [Psychromonas ingrahamii]ABM02548.1 nucleotide phosphate derivative pyrophosphohydrolase, MutT/nudix family protein [Psychromonas ingrahamii 37]